MKLRKIFAERKAIIKMIIKFFSSGTSNGSAPINYLLSSKDHEKKERAVKPEVLTGDSFLTKELIDSLQNKWKYTSGVFAFRENENPNNKELRSMLKDFYLLWHLEWRIG